MRYLILMVVVVFLSGCASTARLDSAQSGSIVRVKNTRLDNKEAPVQSGTGTVANSRNFSTPREESIPTSTFGKYEFKAEHAGYEPLYGVLPRKFNPGYLTLDILFFTPAMFFNLSGVYPYYEFDLEKRVVRYRKSESEPWLTYAPTLEQMNLARAYFKEEPLLPAAVTEATSPMVKNGSQQNDAKTRLSKLEELYESKAITKEEYEVKRAAIINGI
ncbi:MAG: SHOCT domain-containing protein [Gammaproteobacteria bacterium]|nr:SHOCT domain-containing protein [Gammaproteobacteria bacterium]MBU1775074.1 SHOCT domain-containing protein [Gammaproteobacteria bacterium]MBU1969626.1 SHOCT domain-containing protein [Gammaproteobacteria bacterium]